MENGGDIRSFVAVEISDEVRAGLTATLAKLRQSNANVRWVDPENMHLTLNFIGDISARAVLSVRESLNTAGACCGPASFRVAGLGTFGNRNMLRVIWAGVDGNLSALLELQRRVNEAMQKIGLPVSDSTFTPHITIGRVRSGRGIDELKKLIEDNKGIEFGRVNANRFLLLKSVLTPVGPKYSVLHDVPLKAGR